MTRKKVPDLPEVVLVDLKDIRFAKTNPRKIPEAAVNMVALSLQRFGWKQPVVLDENMELVVGHTRCKAAKQLKLRQVPAIIAKDLTEDEIRAYRIADNRTHDFTTWDYPLLVTELDGLADDYSDVLGLQDWHAIVEDFDTALDISDELRPRMDGQYGGFRVTVVFTDEEAALAAQQTIIDLPGVVDVCHPH